MSAGRRSAGGPRRGGKRAAASTPFAAQLGLFDAPSPAAPTVTPREALEALAARLPPRVRLGTSSWTFPGWAGLVYHRAYPSKEAFTRESLREYAAHPLFRTVGLDRAYYGPLREEEFAAYAAQTPEDFRFLVKAWSELTTRRFPKHPRLGARAGEPNPAFLDPELFASRVLAPAKAGLGSRLGVLLVEMPPAPGPADLPAFLLALRGFFERFAGEAPLAVEVRDARLLAPDYFALLREFGVAHTFNYWSRMPGLAEQRRLAGELSGPVVPLRLMLPPGRKYEVLKEEWAPFDRIVEAQPVMRREAIQIAAEAAGAGKDVYVIVNNKAEGSSPRTVEALAEGLASLGPLK